MAPTFALPPPELPLPAYVRQAESGMLVPRQAVLPGLIMPPGLMSGGVSLAPFPTFMNARADGDDSGTTTGVANVFWPKSGAEMGDLLVGWVGYNDNVTNPSSLNGWSYQSFAPSGFAVGLFWKIIDGTEDEVSIFYRSPTIDPPGSQSQSYMAIRVRGAKSAQVAGNTGSTSPNPPILNVGSKQNILWIAGYVCEAARSRSGNPSGFTSISQQFNGPISLAAAYKQEKASSMDPSAFSYGSNASHAAFTIACIP